MTRWLRRVVLVALGVALGLGSSCGGGGDGDADGYSAALKADFVEDCTAAGTSRAACDCLYRGLESEVPFERFEELDQQLRAGSADVPPDIETLAVGCVADPESRDD